MKTKFTKASQKDKTLVTVNLAQFDEDIGYEWRDNLSVGSYVRLIINHQEVAFVVNRVRDGKGITAVTHCFPRFLTLPRIGRPTYAQVTEVD
jgi:hypothetical protein